MHYTSLCSNLSSHLSIFSSLPPSVSTSFSSALLKAFHLTTISVPMYPTPVWHNSYLSLYIPSSRLFLSFFSAFLSSFPATPCPPSPLSVSVCPRRLKLNPVGASLAQPCLPPWLDQGNRTCKTRQSELKLQLVQSSVGSVYFWILFHICTPWPPCSSVCFPPSIVFAWCLFLLISSSDRHCRSLDSVGSLQWLTLIKVANDSPLCVCVCESVSFWWFNFNVCFFFFL